MRRYIHSEIEQKWQKVWDKTKVYSPDIEKASKPFYNLMMFPYPSAEGLHVGNMYAFTGADIYGRYMRMQGFDVFEPIGLDGFGIHSENYALKINEHPMDLSKVTEERFYKQLRSIGNGFDWTRTVETYKPDYYKWTQWLFLQMYKKGLAYRKKAEVNWCPKDLTVLADEQVIAGCCERCGVEVQKKELEQWFFKITDYADRLLNNISKLDWSDKVKIAQKNWIGKKVGINIIYKIEDSKEEVVVFTTRSDTNFGATFIVLGPEHPLVAKLIEGTGFRVQGSVKEELKKYIEKTKNKSQEDRMAEGRKKTGVFTGLYAINNLNGKKLPIWVSDFVLGNVGTGAVVGVPGHDKRDFQFAREFGLEIIRVVVGKDGDTSEITDENQVQEEEGKMVNSEFLDGLDIHEATVKIMDYLEEKGWGEKVTTYHLRDWLISRQRYWGPPIPIIYCDPPAGGCGTVPVPAEDLPVELPYVKEFRPTGSGKSPLAMDESFYKAKCPNCGKNAKRETDVSDTFLDSSWYFLRYPSTDVENEAFDMERTKKWLPVEMYIGGAEHSVLHLLYSRFVTMVLKDQGFIDFEEPFEKFRAHGLIIAEGAKMSKSKGNVVNPDEYIKEYGADTLRLYLMFIGPYTEGGDFREAAINGIYRFLTRVWQLSHEAQDMEQDLEEKKFLNKVIAKVKDDTENLRYNTAISKLMELINFLSKKSKYSKESIKTLLLMLAPFAPHITEELWQVVHSSEFMVDSKKQSMNHEQRTHNFQSIHSQIYPKVESKYLVEDQVTIVVQINGKVRDSIIVGNDVFGNQEEIERLALESKKVQKFLDGQEIRKKIYIPGKVFSIVV